MCVYVCMYVSEYMSVYICVHVCMYVKYEGEKYVADILGNVML